MAKAVKCDRCGQFFEYYDVKAEHNSGHNYQGFNTLTQGSYNANDGYYCKKTYELCTDCCREFNEWLEEANEA